MRKLILISALVLASASAQAGPSRNMTLAANDSTTVVETAQPQTAPPQATQPSNAQQATPAVPTSAAKPDVAKTDYAKADVAKPDTYKPETSAQPRKYRVGGWEANEAKARRIAARYGIYW